MASQNIFSFEGMSPEAARNLAEGMSSIANKRFEIAMERMKEIQGLDEATFSRLKDIAASGNGGCFVGCSGAA